MIGKSRDPLESLAEQIDRISAELATPGHAGEAERA